MLVAAAVASLVGAAPALAAWEAPVRASVGPLPARSPDVAVNARGDAAAVWVRGTGRAAMIVTSLRPTGGEWGAAQAISRRGRPAIDPQVTIDARGLVVVTWRQVVRTRRVRTERGSRRQAVYVARARERGVADPRWSPISTLSDPSHKVGPVRLATDDDGGAVVAWHWGTGTNPRVPGFVGQVQVAERIGAATWTAAERVSRSSLCSEVRKPHVVSGGRGHVVVWWQCDLPGGRSTAVAITRAPGEPFGPEGELPFRTASDVSADLAVSDAGDAAAVSAAADGDLRWWSGDVGSRLALQSLPTLSATERTAPEAGPPQIAVNASGDALTTWTDPFGRARSAPVASDLGVGAASSLGVTAGDAITARVAVTDTTRRGVVVWIADRRVRAASRGADGRIGSGETVSPAGVSVADPPAVAVDAGGTAVLLWTRAVRGRPVVERTSGPVS